MTVSRLLEDQESQRALAGKVLIVDEAGMVSGRLMHDLLHLAEDHGARIVFSRDTRQIEPQNRLRNWRWDDLLPRNAFPVQCSNGRELLPQHLINRPWPSRSPAVPQQESLLKQVSIMEAPVDAGHKDSALQVVGSSKLMGCMAETWGTK